MTKTGDVGEFNRGFLHIVKDTTAPIVPIYLRGLWGSIFSWEGGKVLWKWPNRWPFPVEIVIGERLQEPVDPEQARQAVIALSSSTTAAGVEET
jgi:acyl-[acyl-carrier-protein]-phospholipid O-acyltransferase/long-chain-fatty-acid--[acyl-carrier-protein] ligase